MASAMYNVARAHMPNIDKSLQPLQYKARERVFGIQSAYRETAVERASYRDIAQPCSGCGVHPVLF